MLFLVLLSLSEPATVGADVGATGVAIDLASSYKGATCLGPARTPCAFVQYEIFLANAGASSQSVRVIDPLPEGVDWVPGQASPRFYYDWESRTAQWDGVVLDHRTHSLTFTVASRLGAAEVITNVATICSLNPTSASDCISRSVTTTVDAWPILTPTPTSSPLPRLDCQSAIPMRTDVSLYVGTTRDKPANVQSYSCALWLESGGEVVYRLQIQEPLESFSVGLWSPQQDLDLFVLRGCDPLSCVAGGDRTVRVDDPSGEYFVVVDGRNGARGDYALDLTVKRPTPTATPSAQTATATAAPTRTATATRTASPATTATHTPSRTASPTISRTASSTPSPTPTVALVPRVQLPVLVARFPAPSSPTPTSTPNWPVSLQGVWLEGPRGVANQDFRPCEVVFFWTEITNYSDAPTPITVNWIVRDWQGQEVTEMSYRNWRYPWPSGTYRVYLPQELPADIQLASYSLTVRVLGTHGLVGERTAYFSVSDEPPASSILAESAMCRDVSVDGRPIDITDRFSIQDEAVHAWGWWQRNDGLPHEIEWIWFGPDGSQQATYGEKLSGACTFYAWSWLKIAGTSVAGMPGNWRLEIWMDGSLIGMRTFTIETDMALPTDGGTDVGGGYVAGPCADATCDPWSPR